MAMTLRLDEDREAQLRARARDENRPMHAVVVAAIDDYLRRHASDRFASLSDDVITRHAELLDRLAQ
jgi:predicted transcriptional regulator